MLCSVSLIIIEEFNNMNAAERVPYLISGTLYYSKQNRGKVLV